MGGTQQITPAFYVGNSSTQRGLHCSHCVQCVEYLLEKEADHLVDCKGCNDGTNFCLDAHALSGWGWGTSPMVCAVCHAGLCFRVGLPSPA